MTGYKHLDPIFVAGIDNYI